MLINKNDLINKINSISNEYSDDQIELKNLCNRIINEINNMNCI